MTVNSQTADLGGLVSVVVIPAPGVLVAEMAERLRLRTMQAGCWLSKMRPSLYAGPGNPGAPLLSEMYFLGI